MTMNLSRRTALKSGLTLLGGSMLPTSGLWAAAEEEPHFFLFLNLFPGADSSYMFDARPLAFTAAGKMQNYLGTAPSVWTGRNGVSTLASPLIEPLRDFRDRFSVVNGVHMSSFDGHDQNQSFLLTGNALGGESFMPFLNRRGATPLDVVTLAELFGVTITNGGGSLTTIPSALAGLAQTFKGGAADGLSGSTTSFIASRYQGLGTGSGGLSSGVRNLANGYAGSAELVDKIKGMELGDSGSSDGSGSTVPDSTPINLQVIGQFFQQRIARSLVIGIDGANFDTHDADSAANQPKLFGNAIDQIASLFKFMRDTPFDVDSGKSLFDVTTVLVGAEFGRTMRQMAAPSIDKTGTDHNPLNNSFLIGGKGIVGNLVIGSSDLTTLDAGGNIEGASGAHTQRDPGLLKLMGRPFDYATFRSSEAVPATYDPAHYLNFGSLANTIFDLFGVSGPATPYRRINQGSPRIPSLTPLLA